VGRERDLRGFGTFLRSLREASGLSLEQAVRQLRRQKPPARISISTLSRYECGDIKDPPGPFLQACASLYRIPLEQVVRALVLAKYGLDLEPGVETYGLASQAGDGTSSYLGQLAEVGVLLQRLNGEGMRVVSILVRGLAGTTGYLLPERRPR
jgi:transcriptional regulator with XRE-family HTH domain